jgi:hypothetical protein
MSGLLGRASFLHYKAERSLDIGRRRSPSQSFSTAPWIVRKSSDLLLEAMSV